MGIGISSFTEIVGAGPSKHFDILGIKMFDSCEIRVHPTGKATARFGTKSQGQGHETTYAQIVAEELGIPASQVQVEEADTDTAPYGLGTYASRSTPTAGAAARWRRGRSARSEEARGAPARVLADDLVWEPGKFSVKGAPQRFKTIQDCAFAAYTNHRREWRPGSKPSRTTTRRISPSVLARTSASSTSIAGREWSRSAASSRSRCGNIINR